MISKPFQALVVGLFIVASAAGIVLVRLDNARLRTRVADARKQGERAIRLRDDNQRTKDLLARAEADESDGARAIHADLARARAEVSDLEKRAEENHTQLRAQAMKDAENLANNRDPEKGITRLEYFRNVGQSTPSAAFQTFVWAALKGEDDKLASMIVFSSAAHEKAEAVVAALPDEARAKYPTPEKLAALFFAATFTALPSAEVAHVSVQDSQSAIVNVRGLSEKTQKVPMQLGVQGWQIAVPAAMVERLGGWALGGSQPAKK